MRIEAGKIPEERVVSDQSTQNATLSISTLVNESVLPAVEINFRILDEKAASAQNLIIIGVVSLTAAAGLIAYFWHKSKDLKDFQSLPKATIVDLKCSKLV